MANIADLITANITDFPVNFRQWIDENRHSFKPPICNKLIWKNREFIVMVLGGPNQRTDFHFNEGEELFYQLEGDITLKIREDNKTKDIIIKEGEMFLLPPKIPHSPQRPANTIGLVVERQRLEHEDDGLIWYCENCNTVMYEEYFHMGDIVKQLQGIFERFYTNPEYSTCQQCGLEIKKPC